MAAHEHATPVRVTTASRARRLAYATLGWNGVEAVVALAAAVTSGSVALLGYGIDSAIEVFSGACVLWRFSGGDDQRREQRAARLVGWSLLALGVFVVADGAGALIGRREAATSVLGILLTGLSLVVMLALARAKQETAAQLGSVALFGDARQSAICAWLSAITLVGLACRAITGWWWIDALAGFALVPFIVREGFQVLRARSLEDTCCSTGVPPEIRDR